MKSRLWKRVITAGIATALVAGSLAGCGGKNTAAGSGENGQQTDSREESTDGSTGEKIKVVAATGASPRPFSFYDDNNELTGHNIELVNAIFEKLPQYELVWEVTDFTSIFAGLDSDKYQLGVNNFGMNEERKEKYIFTDPIFANALIVVTNKDIDFGEVISYEDLAGYTFVGSAGVNQTTNIENYNKEHPDAPIEIAYTDEDLNIQLSNIEAGKYDFTTIDAPMFYGYYQPEFGYDVNVANLEGYGTSDGLYSYLLISQGNEQLQQDINAALKEVIEEGTSKEINEKYFGSDYSPSYE